ncbi:hypothetical protein CPB83DRAFT_854158 [Crepidotus variabilis]|uniref:C3H1-type domain-containing protein n=1 Tax=Crepidotus variabilis TaxID=179855 RepID=A0A9P6EH05_9AGAR|nr:hypothetical protein CPB83DRAFT_854158 [Crepidotus variabilis]
MPTEVAQHDIDRDRAGDADRNDKPGSKQKSSASANSKSKDLSHVPCKFFKVGGCTAGASCPFSHSVLEPGQHKETCNWFVKGNCKFGHKCALAHILPGQTMAMDRKNKKAAQTTAGASVDRGKSGARSGKKDAGSSPGNKPSLLTGGSTAPTRMLNSTSSGSGKSGRAPISMSLKATISPSAPAPALTDTDFASFATLDDMEGLRQDSQSQEVLDHHITEAQKIETPTETSNATPSIRPVTLPPSAPRPSTTSAVTDFGPIGSPPNYRPGLPTSPRRINGATFSPGTSPRNPSHLGNLASSPSRNVPVSAPGTQDHFMPSSFQGRAGIAASLGSGLAMIGGRRGFDEPGANVGPNSFGGLLSNQLSNAGVHAGQHGEYGINVEYSGRMLQSSKALDSAVEDDDLEEFLPSSLNDLLTPEERSRRMSRSNSGQQKSSLTDAMSNANLRGSDHLQATAGNGAPAANGTGMGHRYSRSVPAHTLLGDMKNIWADPSSANVLSSSPHRGNPVAYPSPLGGGVASHPDDMGMSMSFGSAGGLGGTPSSLGMMSPSNASAAFLPGLHRHYLDAKAKQGQQGQLGHGGISRGIRGTSNPLFSNNNGGTTNNQSISNSYLQPMGGLGLPSSVANPSGLHTHIHGTTATTYRTPSNPFDLTQTLHQPQPHTSRPIPSNLGAQVQALEDPLAPSLLSPGARALQSHAPGQSLPQGLAAGYSRIHALPPLTNLASPPTGGSYIGGPSPGGPTLGNNSEGPFGDWQPPSTMPQAGVGNSGPPNAGLDSMFSHLSYSAVTGRGGPVGTGPPPGLSRNVSSGRYTQASGGALSPLNGSVVTRDDDILFDMDK